MKELNAFHAGYMLGCVDRLDVPPEQTPSYSSFAEYKQQTDTLPTPTTKHELKTLSAYYRAILNGTKTFEIRKNDRPVPYAVGDVLSLREWDDSTQTYVNGNDCYTVRVTYLLPWTDGYVIMAIEPYNPTYEKTYTGQDCLPHSLGSNPPSFLI